MINGETTTIVTGPPQATGYAIVADTEFGAESRKIEIIQSERAMARVRARSSAHATKSMTSPRPAVTWRVRTRKVGVPSCEQWLRSRVAANSWGPTGVGEGGGDYYNREPRQFLRYVSPEGQVRLHQQDGELFLDLPAAAEATVLQRP